MTAIAKRLEIAADEGFTLSAPPRCAFTFWGGRHRWERFVETVPGVGDVRLCRCGVRRIAIAFRPPPFTPTRYRFTPMPEGPDGP